MCECFLLRHVINIVVYYIVIYILKMFENNNYGIKKKSIRQIISIKLMSSNSCINWAYINYVLNIFFIYLY